MTPLTTNPKLDTMLEYLYNAGWIEGSNWRKNNPQGTPIPSERELSKRARARQTILSDLLAAIPDEKVGTDKIPLNSTERGYNIAIQDAKAAIRAYVGVES